MVVLTVCYQHTPIFLHRFLHDTLSLLDSVESSLGSAAKLVSSMKLDLNRLLAKQQQASSAPERPVSTESFDGSSDLEVLQDCGSATYPDQPDEPEGDRLYEDETGPLDPHERNRAERKSLQERRIEEQQAQEILNASLRLFGELKTVLSRK